MTSKALLLEFISDKELKQIDGEIKKYPAEQKRSAVMQALMIVQKAQGHLTEPAMDAVAAYLEIPPVWVYEVASFYSMYALKPKGKHEVNVCTNISCKLRKSDEIVKALESKLGIKLGETTKDGRFTLKEVECLGACVNAPMMQVNEQYHEHLTPDTLDDVLAQYP